MRTTVIAGCKQGGKHKVVEYVEGDGKNLRREEISLFVMGEYGPPDVRYLTVPLHSDMLIGGTSTT